MTRGRDCDAHRSQGCPSLLGLGKGATKSLPIGCLARGVAAAKAASAVLQMLGRQAARFCSVFRVPCSVFCVLYFVFRALRLAAIAFAKQGARCGSFEQTLGHACLLQGVPACMLFLACRNWPGLLPALLLAATAAALFQMVCNVQIAHAPPACQHVRLEHLFTASAASAAFAAPHAWPRLA